MTKLTSMAPQAQPHFLLVTFPAQGHINPALQFAKRLLKFNVKVTFATSVSAYRRMIKASRNIPDCINFAVFSDGFDDGYKSGFDDTTVFLTRLRAKGTQSLKETILSCANGGSPAPPVTCVVYNPLLPWAAEVARSLNVPSVPLWIQSASVFCIYYYYFNGYDKLISDDWNKPSWSIELPGLPILKSHDLPSFCIPSNAYNFILPLFKEQLDILELEEEPIVLVNSFEELEATSLEAINDKIKLIAVGPLLPSAFLDEKDSSDVSFGGDLFETSKDHYVEWMDTKAKGTIVYISFGTLIVLSKKQKEAIADALLKLRMPFLWVVREKDGEEEAMSHVEELKEVGMIVQWCSQLEVLSHPSLGCFVTHCGWNSTLESLGCGVPVVAFPHWTDQSTNAKLLEDVWGTGVRVSAKEDGFVESEEIKRCIEMVMGGHEKGSEMKTNALKWKGFASEAIKEGGSSNVNLKAFVKEVEESSNRNKVLISNSDLKSESESESESIA